MTTFRCMMVLGLFAAVAVCAAGCDRPETPRDELGTILTEFPKLPNHAETLPLPEGADTNCPIKKNTQRIEQYNNALPKTDAGESAEASAVATPADTLPPVTENADASTPAAPTPTAPVEQPQSE